MLPIILKQVNWFVLQINWLVSIWGTLVVTGLNSLREKCPNVEYSLVYVFLYTDRIRSFTSKFPLLLQIRENAEQNKCPYLDTINDKGAPEQY